MSSSTNPLAAGVPALQAPKATQTMLSPDGQSGEIPVENVQAALKAGFKMGIDMTAPDGTKGTVPVDKAHDAVAIGGFKPAGSSPDAGQAMEPSITSQFAQTTGVPSIIDSAKKSWAASQQQRDEAAKAAKDSIDFIKSGDFGSAAETLLNHIGKPIAQKTESVANDLVNSAYQNVKSNLTELDPNHGQMYASPIIPGPGVSEALKPFAADEAATASKVAPVSGTSPAAKSPSLVQQVKQGENIAQPQTEEALRTSVKSGGAETGLNTVQPQSLRTIVEEPIHSLDSSSKTLYRQIDQAAGTDFKALNEKLSNTEYQIRQLTDTEADQALEAKLESSRTGIIQKIEDAKQQAMDAGVDPKVLDQADAQFKQARALSDVETKVFKNPNIISGNSAMGTPETVNVNSAIKALQKLQDSTKYGEPRLEQALGKEGANTLLKNLYDAQRLGQKALKVQTVAKWLGGAIGVPAILGAGYEVLK